MSLCLWGVAFPPGAEALFDLLQRSKDVTLLLVGHLPVSQRLLVSVNPHRLELFVRLFGSSPGLLDFDVAPLFEASAARGFAELLRALGEFAAGFYDGCLRWSFVFFGFGNLGISGL
jgi:hypothetical protein